MIIYLDLRRANRLLAIAAFLPTFFDCTAFVPNADATGHCLYMDGKPLESKMGLLDNHGDVNTTFPDHSRTRGRDTEPAGVF